MPINFQEDYPTRTKQGWHQCQPYTKYYRQLRKPGNGKEILAQGRTHEMIVQSQTVSLENIHRSNIIWNEYDIFSYMYTYTHT